MCAWTVASCTVENFCRSSLICPFVVAFCLRRLGTHLPCWRRLSILRHRFAFLANHTLLIFACKMVWHCCRLIMSWTTSANLYFDQVLWLLGSRLGAFVEGSRQRTCLSCRRGGYNALHHLLSKKLLPCSKCSHEVRESGMHCFEIRSIGFQNLVLNPKTALKCKLVTWNEWRHRNAVLGPLNHHDIHLKQQNSQNLFQLHQLWQEAPQAWSSSIQEVCLHLLWRQQPHWQVDPAITSSSTCIYSRKRT